MRVTKFHNHTEQQINLWLSTYESFYLLGGELEDKILCPELWQAFPNSICLQFLHAFCSVLLVVLSSQIPELYDILSVCTFWFCIAFYSQEISNHTVATESASVFVILHPFPLNWIFNIILSSTRGSTEWLSSAPPPRSLACNAVTMPTA